ncbi:TPA: ATP-dependent Lon protease [Photobacterium damselae]
MIISPIQAGTPISSPSVNPPTEQAARENRVREKIVATTEPTANLQERGVQGDERAYRSIVEEERPPIEQQKQWAKHRGYQQRLETLVAALSADSYLAESDHGYSMHIKLPRELLEKLAQISEVERTKGVISHHYALATVPNPPNAMLVKI